MTATTSDLRPLLKRLKLGRMLDTLPERIALARRDHLDYADFLQILLVDEVSRRDHGRLELRLRQAGFEQLCRLEDFDWAAAIRLDRRPRSFLAQALTDASGSRRVAPDLLILDFSAQQSIDLSTVRSGRCVRIAPADHLLVYRHVASPVCIHPCEPRRGGMAGSLRRPDPRQQRPRPPRQRQLPDRDRGR